MDRQEQRIGVGNGAEERAPGCAQPWLGSSKRFCHDPMLVVGPFLKFLKRDILDFVKPRVLLVPRRRRSSGGAFPEMP